MQYIKSPLTQGAFCIGNCNHFPARDLPRCGCGPSGIVHVHSKAVHVTVHDVRKKKGLVKGNVDMNVNEADSGK